MAPKIIDRELKPNKANVTSVLPASGGGEVGWVVGMVVDVGQTVVSQVGPKVVWAQVVDGEESWREKKVDPKNQRIIK